MRWITCTIMAFFPAIAAAADPPNVLIVITDDQGYGELGAHGNPVVKTPRLDAFAKQSVWLRNFYVSPVCSPTRASLLTGFYNYRTGVVDTFLGRSMVDLLAGTADDVPAPDYVFQEVNFPPEPPRFPRAVGLRVGTR